MNIRQANNEDIASMIELAMQLQKIENSFSSRVVCGNKTKEFFEMVFSKYLDDKDYIFLVAEEEGIVGLAFGWKENIHPIYKNEFVGYIADVIVDEKERGKGIGKELTKQLEEEFKKMGLKETKLIVQKDNKKAHKLWEKLGYEDLYIEMRKDL